MRPSASLGIVLIAILGIFSYTSSTADPPLPPANPAPAVAAPATEKKPTFKEIYEQADYSATLIIIYEREIEVTVTEWQDQKQPNGTVVRKPVEVKKKEKQFDPAVMSGFVAKDEENGKFYVYTAGHIYRPQYKIFAIEASFKKNLPKKNLELFLFQH